MKYDLLSKGINEEIIEEKLATLIDEDEEKELTLSLAKKYLKGKEFDSKTRQKFYNHMLGKGFDFSLIGWAWEEVQNGRD